MLMRYSLEYSSVRNYINNNNNNNIFMTLLDPPMLVNMSKIHIFTTHKLTYIFFLTLITPERIIII